MKKKLLFPILLIAILFACATFTNNAYKSLSVSKVTYDSALSTAADLYAKDILSEDERENVIKYARIYKDAHNSAVMALLKYERTNDPEAKKEYYEEMSVAAEFLSKILDLVETEVN